MPPECSWKELVGRTGLVAFLAVCARLYPARGVRKMFSQALAAVLLRHFGEAAEHHQVVRETEKLVQLVARIDHSNVEPWRNLTTETAQRLQDGKRCKAMPTVVKLLGLPAECVEVFALGGGTDKYDERARVLHDDAELTRVCKQINDALVDAEATVFQRSGALVHVFRLDRQAVDKEAAATGVRHAAATCYRRD